MKCLVFAGAIEPLYRLLEYVQTADLEWFALCNRDACIQEG